MAEELGKIEKPPVEKFAGVRKVIMVPLIFSGKNAPQDFLELYNRCWGQIAGQVAKLEARLGQVTRIYHEMILASGQEGMKILEQLNPSSHQLVKARGENGTNIQPIEDAELAAENMDWERCLMVAMSEKARAKILEFHAESSARRYEYIGRKIDETLGEGEIGLLFIREGHRVQFPGDMEILNVYPPALDEIHRWLRDYGQRMSPSEEKEGK